MFYSLSKILWVILSPLNLIFLIMAIGAVISIFSKAQGRSLFIFGFCLFTLFGIVPAGSNMLVLLEKHHERPQKLPEKVDGILVLGGAFISDVTQERKVPAMNEASERVIEAIILANLYPNALLVFSGGKQKSALNGRSEADDASSFLDHIGYNQDNVIYEDLSRNTFENIKNSRSLLLPQAEETWLLVTSAYHMPRAYAVARKQGWSEIIPYPVDYRTAGKIGWIPQKLNLIGSYAELDLALHEFVGIGAYHLTGKITLPLK